MASFDDYVVNHLEDIRSYKNWYETQRFIVLALAGEVGELANFVKKEWRGDGDKSADIIKELADIHNYTAMLAKLYEVNLDDIGVDKFIEVEKRPTYKGRLTHAKH